MLHPDWPQIAINYSPKLDLRLRCVSAHRIRQAGWVEYRFEVKCRLPHPSGSFEYSAADLCFDIESFARFGQELLGIQQGKGNQAELKSAGEMLALRLAGNSRKFHAELKIREYLAPHVATLTSVLEVDYDLYVNKLAREVESFVAELRRVVPDDIGEGQTGG